MTYQNPANVEVVVNALPAIDQNERSTSTNYIGQASGAARIYAVEADAVSEHQESWQLFLEWDHEGADISINMSDDGENCAMTSEDVDVLF